MITSDHLTRLAFIECILGVQYTGKSFTELAQFIQAHFRKARKAEPSFKQWLHGNEVKV